MRRFTPMSLFGSFCLLFCLSTSLAQQAQYVNYQDSRSGQEIAHHYYNEGNDFLDMGDLESANAAYTQALAHYKQHQKARFNRAYVLYNMRHYEAAIFDFNLVLQTNSQDAEAYEMRGMSYFYLSNFYEASEDFTSAIALKNNLHLYLIRGRAYGKMGKYVEAFRDLDLVIRFEPNNSEAYSRKAEVYTAIRQYHSALRAYDKAIQNAKEEDAFLYNNRASVLCNLGRYEDAIQDFTTALSIEWTYRVFANRGLAQNENGAHEAARWDGIAAMHLNPDGADAYFCIGLSEMGQGDYDAAIMSFDIAIDEAPDVFQYYLSRSRAKMMLQQYYPALEDCYKALELEPESIEADDLQRLLFDAVERNNPVMTNAIEMPMQQPINELKIQIDPLPYEGSTDTEEYLFEDPYGKGN